VTPTTGTKKEAERGDEWADKGWTVQVNATTNPQQSTDLVRALRGKGYDAYIVQAPMHGQTWYRVRVGRFQSRDKAKELEAKLKTSEGMENAYVTPQ
jgi:cell division septation protein DedD